jgi:hypothetical protein
MCYLPQYLIVFAGFFAQRLYPICLFIEFWYMCWKNVHSEKWAEDGLILLILCWNIILKWAVVGQNLYLWA